MDLRLSIGTEAVLGLRKVKIDALPTTAYLMMGSNCLNRCMFCPQSQTSQSKENLLSRVSWNKVQGNIWPIVEEVFTKGLIQRACIQAVNKPGINEALAEEIKRARAYTKVPLCVSGGVNSLEEIGKLIEQGADRITIALDAVTPEIHKKMKAQDFFIRLGLIKKASDRYPGKIGTHLIAGLGETEEQMIRAIQEMYDEGVTVALFAFTPIKGTLTEQFSQPAVSMYRRIQIAHYLIKEKICGIEDMIFENGKLIKLIKSSGKMREALNTGEAFLTSGCPGCNRPYYNERPGSVMYNYPVQMTRQEIEKAIEDSELLTIMEVLNDG